MREVCQSHHEGKPLLNPNERCWSTPRHHRCGEEKGRGHNVYLMNAIDILSILVSFCTIHCVLKSVDVTVA